MACTASSLIVSAYANGYAKLSERALKECILAAACAGGGGGGGGVATVAAGQTPSGAPSSSGTITYSLDPNPGMWIWNGSVWVQILAPGP